MSAPQKTNGKPTLPEAIKILAKAYGPGKFKDIPAKVLSYNAAQQTVDCQPLVLNDTVQGLKPFPIAREVQVRWPAGSTWSIVGDLVAGDFGWLVPAGGDISAWKAQGTELDPTAIPRKDSFSDLRFEPGSQPVSTPLAADAYKASALVIRAAELLLGDSTATAFVALADLVDAIVTTIQTTFDAHVHADPVSGYTGTALDGTSFLPSLIGTQSSVAATKVKAK